VALLLLAGCGEPPPQVAELSGSTMGTTYSIKLAPPPQADARGLLAREVDARLEAINRQMSTYLPDSDLTRFNDARTTDWQAVPEPLVDLVERARRISEHTDGRYDVTVGPLVDLWGFGSAGSRDTRPGDAEIAAVLDRTGYRRLHARRAPPALRKEVAGLRVDLSSIAKGWAVDQLAELLQHHGFGDFLVEIGGELRAQGEKAPGRPWQVAIERPLAGRREVQRVVALRDMAMASSGDYRNFFTEGGRRYSHTIDPQTGQAVQHRLAAVTVFAENCTDADAWATALMALGEQHGPEIAAALDLQALFIVREGDELIEMVAPALHNARLWRQAD
jgi:thiamine biosynthesis lipoprotein